MAFKSYLIRYFEFTHENIFFRKISSELRKVFQDKEGLHVLVGNLGCDGHVLDALFIASGKVIVIDFKDYGGTLTFSENNPWRMETGKDFVFVKGGGSIRNPFQQVNAYRNSLRLFLNSKLNQILEPNHENLNFGHITGMVLFHKPVAFDKSQIPTKIQNYFEIADCTNYINAILDRASPELRASDTEIQRILSILDVKEENLYDEAQPPSEEPYTPTLRPDAAERLQLVKKLLQNVNPKSDLEKVITYYQTLLNLERKKDVSITEKQDIPFSWQDTYDQFTIDLENIRTFLPKFQQNLSSQFPKDLFIGIYVNFSGQDLLILHAIFPAREVPPNLCIEIPLNDFALYARSLEDKEYPQELTEELETALLKQTTLEDKLKTLEKFLEGKVVISDKILLAFSETSPATHQLFSELNTLQKQPNIKKGSLIESFLLKTPIKPQKTSFDNAHFVSITPMNENQMEAVKWSFQQPLTVITGPPGTGKTQVVLNILANAVVQGKKVLLASKNNQAVDNVKDRLATIIKENEYLLRFGAKSTTRDKTIPAIQGFISKIHNKLYKNYQQTYIKTQEALKNANLAIEKAQAKLKKNDQLLNDYIQLETQLQQAQQELIDFQNQHQELLDLATNLPENELQNHYTNAIKLQSKISSSKKGFFKRLLYKWCYKKRILNEFNQFVENLPSELKLSAPMDATHTNPPNDENAIHTVCNHIAELLKNIRDFQNQKAAKEKNIDKLTSQLEKKHKEYKEIEIQEPELLKIIQENRAKVLELSRTYVDTVISKKLNESRIDEVNAYKDSIPVQISNQNGQQNRFVEVTKHFLNAFNMVAVTNLSVKTAFPLATEIFDMVVIDEASQCDIISAIPLIYRAKQLVVIGDPLQLKHITSVQDYEDKFIQTKLKINPDLKLDYVKQSLYDYCFTLSILSGFHSILLKDHFRCHPEIIGYSNKVFYGPRLGQELEVFTNLSSSPVLQKGMFWNACAGKIDNDSNINRAEVDLAVGLACELASKHEQISIGITTPFAGQAKALNDAIPTTLKHRIKAETVHKFQGDEKDVMIVSLVVSDNATKNKANWINNSVPYLLNVAVTRARSALFIVGNKNYCKKLHVDTPLRKLADYYDELGKR